MRNNEERFGSVEQVDDVAPQVSQSKNIQQFNFVVPTEFVDLPSKGQFYPEHHPLHKCENVELRHMTAKDEDTLTSKSYIKKGVVLDRLLKDLLVDKSIDPTTLLSGDKNALLVAARISGYGSDYETKVSCPNCNTTQLSTFDLNECVKTKYTTYGLGLDEVQLTENCTFTTILPLSKIKIEFKLLNGLDELEITKKLQEKKDKNSKETNVTDLLRLMIVSIDGVNDHSLKEKFISVIPTKDYRYLKDTYYSINPTVQMKAEFTCQSCDYEQELEVPFTTDFFWPK